MRLFVYVPEAKNTDQLTAKIDSDFPEDEFEIEYASDKDDLAVLVKHYDYDAVLVIHDENEAKPYGALDVLSRRELLGPVICVYQNAQHNTLFNVVSRGVTSTVPYAAETFTKGTFRMLVNNAYVAFKGRSSIKEFGVIKIDFDKRMVLVNDQPINLTGKEFKLFEYLVDHEGQVKNKEQIYSALYGQDDDVEIKIVDVFICKLRDELDNALPGLGQTIETSWGNGYRFLPNPDEEKTYTKRFADFELDFTNLEARIKGDRIDLTIREFMVLKSFVAQYPDAVSEDRLIREAEKYGTIGSADILQRTIQSLLKKLKEYGDEYEHLLVKRDDDTYILNLADIDARAARRVEQDITTLGPLKINQTTKQVYFKNQRVKLTAKEYDILSAMAAGFPDIMSLAALAERVYGDPSKTASVSQTLGKLRTKLKASNKDKDVIVTRRGEGFRLDLHSKQIEKKFADRFEEHAVGAWRIDSTRRIAYFQPEGERKEIELTLNASQFKLLSHLIAAYPKALPMTELLTRMYGADANDKETALVSTFAQLKASLISQLGDDGNHIRKIDFLTHKLFRLDVGIDDIPSDAMASCDIVEVGVWDINRTAHMVCFDGDPIAVTDREFYLMEALACRYPKRYKKEDLAKALFNESEASLNSCLTGLRRKLRDDYNVTQDVTRYKRTIGYVLNADMAELNEDKINAFDTVSLGAAVLNRDLAQITSADTSVDISAASLFALDQLLKSDTPMTSEQLSYASLDGDAVYEEATINTALTLGVSGIPIIDDNRVAGFFLHSKRSIIVANSDCEQIGPLTLNHTLHELTCAHVTIALTRSEYTFVCALAGHLTTPMTKEAISDFSIEEEGADPVTETTLNLTCGSIQGKFKEAGFDHGDVIKNKRGMGYFFAHMEGHIDFGTGTRLINLGSLAMDTQTGVAQYDSAVLTHVVNNMFTLMTLLAKNNDQFVSYHDIAAVFFGADKAADNIKNAEKGAIGLRNAIAKTHPDLADQLITNVPNQGCKLSVRTGQFGDAVTGTNHDDKGGDLMQAVVVSKMQQHI